MEKCQKAEIEASNDLHKPVEQLLADIHDESLCDRMDRPYEITIVRTTARFASLLAVLAKRLERLQWWIIALTVALLIFTVGLVFVGVAQLRSSYVLEQLMKHRPVYIAPTNDVAPQK